MAQESECWVLYRATKFLSARYERVFASVNRAPFLARLKAGSGASPAGLALEPQPLYAWPPEMPLSRRSRAQGSAAAVGFGFQNFVHNPRGIDLVGWEPGDLGVVEAKGVNNTSLSEQLRGVLEDLTKLVKVLVATKGEANAWMFIDARPYPAAAALVDRVLARFSSSWPDPRVRLALVGADPSGFPRSCVTCGFSPWEPSKGSDKHRDIVLDDGDLSNNHQCCDLESMRPCAVIPDERDVVVLDPSAPLAVTAERLNRLPPELWPQHTTWAARLG